MNKPKFVFVAAVIFVCLFSASLTFAQIEVKQTPPSPEPSYDVVLQILVGSNDASERSALPPALSNIAKKLKSNYPLSNYNLASTYLQRVANTGNVEFKSVSKALDQDLYTPSFSEWTLGQLRNMPGAAGATLIQMQNFRFGQRIPVRVANYQAEPAKQNYAINYESVGLTIQKLSVSENVPTLLGSLSTSKPDEVMFLVITVRRAEN